MNYNKLWYFYMVAQTLNFSKAADRMYMSTSVISRHIADLEDELKMTLFVRTNRNLQLTKAGQLLLVEYTPFFAKENEVLNKLRAVYEAENTQIKLSFVNTQYSNRLLDIRADFEQKYPHLQLAYKRDGGSSILQDVSSKNVDVGIVVRNENDAPYSEELFYIGLIEDTLSLIVPKYHPLANCVKISMLQMQGEIIHLIDPRVGEDQYKNTVKIFQRIGIKPTIVAEYPNIESVLSMVQVGAGVSLQSPFAPLEGIANIVCIPIHDAPKLFLDVVWRKSSYGITLGYLLDLILQYVV